MAEQLQKTLGASENIQKFPYSVLKKILCNVRNLSLKYI